MKSFTVNIVSIAIAGLLTGHIAAAQEPVTRSANFKSHYTAWPPIKESEIAHKKRVWENINLTDKKNGAFAIEGRSNALINIVTARIKDGKMDVYAGGDDRLLTTSKLTADDFTRLMASSPAITGYRVKEDSLQLKTGEITVRILCLAPLTNVTAADGSVTQQPLFWIYYPDARPYFAECQVGSVSWDDVFEQRLFAGKVIPRPVSKAQF